jgi:Asp-tRNA(Asn)/Glu-tRNA(Gln) amidotransferase C subunit
MARLESLSRLSLRREGGMGSEYERARADVAAMLSAAGQLAGVACGEAHLAARLRALPEGALEAAARARWERLRGDEVTEGGDAEAVVAHAAVREGQLFSAPRFVGGGEGEAVPPPPSTMGCAECG